MRVRLLFVVGSLLVVSALAIGVVGILQAGGPPGVPGFASAGSLGDRARMMAGTGPSGFMGSGGTMGYYRLPAGGQSISIDQAQQDVERYVVGYGNPDLKLSELVQFQNNFYAGITEKSSGVGAFALLVNRVSGAVGPEPGPNMMWNSRYGMAAMCSPGARGSSVAMTVSSEQAQTIA